MQWMWMQWMQMPSIHLLWRVTRIYAFALGGPSRSLFLMLSANLSTNSWSSRRQSWGSQVTQVTPRYDMIWHGMTRYFQFKSFTTPSPQGKLEYRPSQNVSKELFMRRQSRLWAWLLHWNTFTTLLLSLCFLHHHLFSTFVHCTNQVPTIFKITLQRSEDLCLTFVSGTAIRDWLVPRPICSAVGFRVTGKQVWWRRWRYRD